MSAQTPVYLYTPRQQVVLIEQSARATIRYQKVYSKSLTLNKGVDNLIQFSFVNQEQRPVRIEGKDITCRIINYNGTELIMQKTLDNDLACTGIASLKVSAADLQMIDPQQCYYSLEIPVDTFDYPVFVDANSGARGIINIENSVLPAYLESREITIPSHLQPLQEMPLIYTSSNFSTKNSPSVTFQKYFADFTGTIQFQGSTIMDFSTYYPIGNSETYNMFTGTNMTTVTGYHPFIRLEITNVGSPPPTRDGRLLGDVVKLLARQ